MVPALVDGPVTVFHGDALDVLREMPDESVHMVLTSPPYWGLRDYNQPGQLGLEATPDEYVANMVRLFREVRRVLRQDATCWLNLGDSFQNKQLVGMPWRVAFALQTDGWYLRSDIIWAKPNPMPESVTDRPANSHEHVFLLTRSPRYFFDQDAVREDSQERGPWSPVADKQGVTGMEAMSTSQGRRYTGFNARYLEQMKAGTLPAGRNLRSVWQIATQPYSEAHFATFPEQLCMAPIKAGTSEKGCCPDCGGPWRRMVERAHFPLPNVMRDDSKGILSGGGTEGANDSGRRKRMGGPFWWKTQEENPPKQIGWEPTCACGNEATVPCTVLDPFAGSGTTLAVARRLGRRAIGIELSQSYIDTLIRPRISGAALPLLEFLQEAGG